MSTQISHCPFNSQYSAFVLSHFLSEQFISKFKISNEFKLQNTDDLMVSLGYLVLKKCIQTNRIIHLTCCSKQKHVKTALKNLGSTGITKLNLNQEEKIQNLQKLFNEFPYHISTYLIYHLQLEDLFTQLTKITELDVLKVIRVIQDQFSINIQAFWYSYLNPNQKPKLLRQEPQQIDYQILIIKQYQKLSFYVIEEKGKIKILTVLEQKNEIKIRRSICKTMKSQIIQRHQNIQESQKIHQELTFDASKFFQNLQNLQFRKSDQPQQQHLQIQKKNIPLNFSEINPNSKYQKLTGQNLNQLDEIDSDQEDNEKSYVSQNQFGQHDNNTKTKFQTNQIFYQYAPDKLNQQIQCSICFGEMDQSILIPGCYHKLHESCLRQQVLAKLENGAKSEEEFRCFGSDNCKSLIPLNILQKILDQKQMEQLMKRIAETKTNFNCPNCSLGIIVDRTIQFEIQTIIQCPGCKDKICSLCKEKDHGINQENTSCPKIIKEGFIVYEDQTVIVCPFCFSPSTKDINDACDHVKCQRCGYDLCAPCSADRRPIIGHGSNFIQFNTYIQDNIYHRVGCQHYKLYEDPMTKQEYVPPIQYNEKNCGKCRKTQKACEYPESMQDYQAKFPQYFQIQKLKRQE